MKLRERLKQLEHRIRPSGGDHRPPERLHNDWLEVFVQHARDGTLEREPDFPVALAAYRDALARAQTDPAFYPGGAAHRPDLRSQAHFPELDGALLWLVEMLRRHLDKVPPVSEAQFADLHAWFDASSQRLYQLALPSQLLQLEDGRTTSTSTLRYCLDGGPRKGGSGKVARDVRWLRNKYG
jgi:hypothetical protein